MNYVVDAGMGEYGQEGTDLRKKENTKNLLANTVRWPSSITYKPHSHKIPSTYFDHVDKKGSALPITLKYENSTSLLIRARLIQRYYC